MPLTAFLLFPSGIVITQLAPFGKLNRRVVAVLASPISVVRLAFKSFQYLRLVSCLFAFQELLPNLLNHGGEIRTLVFA